MVDHGGLRIEAFQPRAVYGSSASSVPSSNGQIPCPRKLLRADVFRGRAQVGDRDEGRLCFGEAAAFRAVASVVGPLAPVGSSAPSDWSLDPSEEQAKSSVNREIMPAITAIITGVRSVPCECCAFSGSSIINAGYKSGSYPPSTAATSP